MEVIKALDCHFVQKVKITNQYNRPLSKVDPAGIIIYTLYYCNHTHLRYYYTGHTFIEPR